MEQHGPHWIVEMSSVGESGWEWWPVGGPFDHAATAMDWVESGEWRKVAEDRWPRPDPERFAPDAPILVDDQRRPWREVLIQAVGNLSGVATLALFAAIWSWTGWRAVAALAIGLGASGALTAGVVLSRRRRAMKRSTDPTGTTIKLVLGTMLAIVLGIAGCLALTLTTWLLLPGMG
jgi:hypothetical protein